MKNRLCWNLSLTVQLLLCCLILSACAKTEEKQPLTLGISPYQDLAMIVNIEPLGLEKKYGTSVKLITMPWEDMLPSIASAGTTIDIGFASLDSFLTQQPKLNTSKDDPVVYIYPAYVFKGGCFVTFNKEVPTLTAKNIHDTNLVRKFLSYRIGAEKNSTYELMLYTLAKQAGVPRSQLHIFDTPLNDGILATQAQSLDMAGAGLTQRCEALKRGGRVVLTMDDMGLADFTGFACKSSTLKARRKEIQSLIHMWFDCVDFVFSDMDKNSKYSLAYLSKNASTKYTLAEYKTALSDEYFPRNSQETAKELLSLTGKYSIQRISKDISDYLIDIGILQKPPAPLQILELND